MDINSPIGIFDSGLGGLTVVRQIFDRLPNESVTYLGDQIHIPYGERTPQEIQGFALGITDFLIRQNAKLVIMACNMSSATALGPACRIFPDAPVIGVIEAGVRAAIRCSTGAPIGVLATSGTVNTKAYTKTIAQFLPEGRVFEQACPRFVPLVEAGLCESPEAESAVRDYVEPLIAMGCGTLILGCTHYPFLINMIRKVAGPEIRIIDPAEETAIEAANILSGSSMLNPPHAESVRTYYTSADPEVFAELGGQFLGRNICEVQNVTWGLDLREIEWQEKTEGQKIQSAL